jgi:hypothetical protein
MTLPAAPRTLALALLACAAVAACGSAPGTAAPGGRVDWADHAAGTPASDLASLEGVDDAGNGAQANDTIRIVSIDGRQVPSQLLGAKGADAVSLKPGLHDVKLLWVHGANGLDSFTYASMQVETRPNCRYSFHATSGRDSQMVRFDLTRAPLSAAGNQDCGRGMLSDAKVAG